jgi:cell division protein FtsB
MSSIIQESDFQQARDFLDAKHNEEYFYKNSLLRGFNSTASGLASSRDVHQATQNLDYYKQKVEGFVDDINNISPDPDVTQVAQENTRMGLKQADTAATLLENAATGASAAEDKLTMARALYQHQAMIGQVAGNNQKMMERNLDTLRRAYLIQRYEEEKNNDRRRIISNLCIVLLLLVIVVILYKNNTLSISFVYTSFLLAFIFIGCYLSYQYYYDYYIRDQVYYKERRFNTNSVEDNSDTSCPEPSSATSM